MSGHAPGPPPLACRALHLFVRGDGAEHLLGDLEEEFRRRSAGGMPEAATRWYRRQALQAIVAWWAPHNRLARRQIRRQRAGIAAGRRGVAWALGVVAGATGGIGLAFGPLGLGFRETASTSLVFVHAVDRTGERYQQFTFPEVDALRATATSLVHVAGYSVAGRIAVRSAGGRFDVRVARVSEGFFDALAGPVHLGRHLSRQELRDAEAVAVISVAFWTDALGGDSSVVGSTVTISGALDVAVTIVGVMPAAFALPADADVWVPASRWLRQDTDREVSVIALLADGVTIDEASAQVATLVRRMRSAWYGPAGVRSAWVERVVSVPGRMAPGAEPLAVRTARRGAGTL